jgi:hypothetical protein
VSEVVWRRGANWVGSEVEDSFVMMNIDSAAYVALNRTAHAVWEALESPATESEITAKLIERFDVSPQECRAAVLRLLQKMLDLKLAGAVPTYA